MGREQKFIEASFCVVTPMFLGGADMQASWIGEKSLKGALAFWWRALSGAHYLGKKNCDEKTALQEMREKESRLFGGADGQGLFLLKITEQPSRVWKKGEVLRNAGATVVGAGARYLGYGLMTAFGPATGKLERSAIQQGEEFKLRVLFLPKAGSEEIEEIAKTLKIFGLLGGLGSRTRRGYGSVSLLKMTATGIERDSLDFSVPDSVICYERMLQDALKTITESTVSGINFPITAFAQETRIHVDSSKGTDDALIALDNLGRGFLRYRGRGDIGEKAFKADHRWFKVHRGDGAIPVRTAFGLPHNYGQELGITACEPHDRRASPLFFHIHKIGEKYHPVAVFFHNKFLPTAEIAVRKGNHKTPRSYSFDATIITDFLDGVQHSDSGRGSKACDPYFPSKNILQQKKSSP